MTRKKVSIILNILIIFFGIAGVVIAIKMDLAKGFFLYYTNLSNLYAVVASIVYLATINEDQKLAKMLRYSATVCLMLTLLVVIFILTPMLRVNLFIGNYMPLYHLIIPLISLISLLFFEEKEADVKSAIIPTIIYGLVILFLNIFKVIEGPYPFLKVYRQKIIISIMWIAILYCADYLIAIIIKEISKKIELK